MRTPNQYLAPAFARLQGGPLRDCSETMRWGERTGTVSRVGSPRRGEDTVLDSDIPEECRVLAPVVPFCGLARGDAVELGNTFRVVTSAIDNITRSAFFTVGLSAAFDTCRAAYSGTRRVSGQVRTVKMPIDVLVLETADIPEYGDSPAQSVAQTWLVCVCVDKWTETTPPQTSDVMEFEPPRSVATQRFHVASVVHHGGYWMLRVRPRGGA